MSKAWGPATWFLFHTLAEKVKEENFTSVKDELLDYITRICAHLPCPDCQAHAITKMNTLNKNNIKTKEDLKLMLLSFHNEVNARTKKPPFTVEQLNEKYQKGNFYNILNYFLQIWGGKNANPKLMNNSFHKSRLITEFTMWIYKNVGNFNV